MSVYDSGGQRVKKVFSQGSNPISTTIYIGDIYECTDGNCTKYIFGGSQRIAKIDDTDTHYFHSDHLGSSSVVTDSAGNTVQNIDYYPFGQIQANTGSDVSRYKYTDQEWDAETGLYYYNARYYDPKLARFTTADTIVPDYLNPQSLNRYSYVINNPIRYTDPSGHSWLGDLWDGVKDVFKSTVGAVVEMVAGTAMMIIGAVNIATPWGLPLMKTGAILFGHGLTSVLSLTFLYT